jgi:tRNA-2-methylthio-N6-dimethylallyladenosine synthase
VKSPGTYFFETYGCQMNTAESRALELILRERGWEAAPGERAADLVLLSTCSVRQTAETRLRGRLAQYQALKKNLRREGKKTFTLVVSGCMASRWGEKLKEDFSAVDYVMNTVSRSAFPRILEALETGGTYADPPEKPAFSFSSFHLEEGAFRSFLPIMHGCNNFCSYCIVPYVRGREISRDPASIAEEISLLSRRGVKEITLLGQNVNSYRWGDQDFSGLLRRIAESVRGSSIERVRFLSANPRDFSSETVAVMAENPCFCRRLHLPVQHGSNRVLKAMNRRYTRESYLALAGELRKAMPDLSFSTDILVGFPGETEEDLEETLNLMEEIKFLYAYMYHFNPREGTAAFTFPHRVPEALKRERLGRVIALQKRHTVELLQGRLGAAERILIEGISRKNAEEVIGRTERDEMVVVPRRELQAGTMVEARLVSLRGNTFRGRLLCPGDCSD